MYKYHNDLPFTFFNVTNCHEGWNMRYILLEFDKQTFIEKGRLEMEFTGSESETIKIDIFPGAPSIIINEYIPDSIEKCRGGRYSFGCYFEQAAMNAKIDKISNTVTFNSHNIRPKKCIISFKNSFQNINAIKEQIRSDISSQVSDIEHIIITNKEETEKMIIFTCEQMEKNMLKSLNILNANICQKLDKIEDKIMMQELSLKTIVSVNLEKEISPETLREISPEISRECKICFHHKKITTFPISLPCKHSGICELCWGKLEQKTKCPFCRSNINQLITPIIP